MLSVRKMFRAVPFLVLAAFICLQAQVSVAHMEMMSPPPRRSRFSGGSNIDYDMKSPLNAYNFPCKGYGPGPSVASVTAGSSIQVEFDGAAVHNGGHCQFALSYDGSSFVVIKDIIRDCLTGTGLSFPVEIPSEAPSGDAVFAWTWINASGNREFYMNCADITVQGSSGSLTGPELLVVNLPPTYPTIIPEFPHANSPDNSELFGQRPSITVSSNGYRA